LSARIIRFVSPMARALCRKKPAGALHRWY